MILGVLANMYTWFAFRFPAGDRFSTLLLIGHFPGRCAVGIFCDCIYIKHAPITSIWIARPYAAKDTLRHRNLRRAFFEDSKKKVSYGGVVYLRYATPGRKMRRCTWICPYGPDSQKRYDGVSQIHHRISDFYWSYLCTWFIEPVTHR